MGEVELCIEFLLMTWCPANSRPLSEVIMWGRARCGLSGLPWRQSRPVQFLFDFVYQGETGLTLNQTDNGLLAVFADDGIGFPVTNPAACFDYGWTLLNELPIRYDAAMVILSVALFCCFWQRNYFHGSPPARLSA